MNMGYEIAILIFICVSSLPLSYTRVGTDMKVHDKRIDSPHRTLVAQSGSMPATNNHGTRIPETKESDRSMKKENSKATSENTSSQPLEKPVPLKEFVPSEKIEADKAVDFPADI